MRFLPLFVLFSFLSTGALPLGAEQILQDHDIAAGTDPGKGSHQDFEPGTTKLWEYCHPKAEYEEAEHGGNSNEQLKISFPEGGNTFVSVLRYSFNTGEGQLESDPLLILLRQHQALVFDCQLLDEAIGDKPPKIIVSLETNAGGGYERIPLVETELTLDSPEEIRVPLGDGDIFSETLAGIIPKLSSKQYLRLSISQFNGSGEQASSAVLYDNFRLE